MSETIAYGIFGGSELGSIMPTIRHGIKSTTEYRNDPTLLNWAGLQRNVSLVAPHGSRARFEVPLQKRSPIYAIPQGNHGLLWDQMRKVRVNNLGGKIGVSRHIFLPPISHEMASTNPPINLQETAFVELATPQESLNPFSPRTVLKPGEVMIVTCLGDALLDEVTIGFGENTKVFDPTKIRQRLGMAASLGAITPEIVELPTSAPDMLMPHPITP